MTAYIDCTESCIVYVHSGTMSSVAHEGALKAKNNPDEWH